MSEKDRTAKPVPHRRSHCNAGLDAYRDQLEDEQAEAAAKEEARRRAEEADEAALQESELHGPFDGMSAVEYFDDYGLELNVRSELTAAQRRTTLLGNDPSEGFRYTTVEQYLRVIDPLGDLTPFEKDIVRLTWSSIAEEEHEARVAAGHYSGFRIYESHNDVDGFDDLPPDVADFVTMPRSSFGSQAASRA